MLKRLRTYLRKVYPFIHPYKKLFWAFAVIYIVMQPLGQVGAAHFVRELFDAVASGDVESVYFWAVAWCVFIAATLAVMFGQWYLRARFDVLTVNHMRKRMLDHILSSKKEKLDKYHSGDLMARMNNDIAHALGLLTNIMLQMIVQAGTFALMFLYILFINPVMVVIPILSLPISLIASRHFGPKVNQLHREIQQRWSIIHIKLQDMLRGMQVVKAYDLEEKLHDEHMDNRNFIIDKELRNVKLHFFLGLGTGGSSSIAEVMTLLVAGYLYMRNMLPLGSVMVTIFGVQFLIHPLRQIPNLLANMESHIASIDRVYEILDIEEEDLQTGNTRTSDSSCSIDFSEVEFCYNPGDLVLKGVSFQIKPGEKHAFVGLTGSGKSTIVRLILQFYKPSKGEILFDSQKLNIQSVRSLISYVPQEPYLFTGTIRENMSYGNVNASFEDIVEAAKAADAHDFISAFPNGYDTELGEEGITLSGGQRQRIAIARALLKDAPIIIWDEATSSLDTISESRVQQMLDAVRDRTVIIIAHRLSTVKNADVIHVMHDGQIIESGDHDSLLKLKGHYYQLYHAAAGA